MKKLIQTGFLILICQLCLTGQNLKQDLSYQHAIQLDIAGLFQKEITGQYEKPLGKRSSLLASLGYKKHTYEQNFQEGIQLNNYIERYTEQITWIVLFPLPSDDRSNVAGTPLPEYGDFVPKYSIPVRLNYRYYLARNEAAFRFFLEPGIQGTYHSGLSISDRFSIDSVNNYSEFDGIPFLAGTTSTTTDTYMTQTRTSKQANKFLVGANLALGFQWRLAPSFGIAFTTEIGSNSSGSNHFDNYTISKRYVRLTAGLLYAF